MGSAGMRDGQTKPMEFKRFPKAMRFPAPCPSTKGEGKGHGLRWCC